MYGDQEFEEAKEGRPSDPNMSMSNKAYNNMQ
jgi:hypothetical protein